VGELREEVAANDGNITQHLNILRHQGIIEFRRDANFIYNRISDERIITLMQAMERIFCAREKRRTND
jgi:ArsR family transcriptional regulator